MQRIVHQGGIRSQWLLQRLLFVCLIIVLSSISSSATHNRAGEITYEQTGDLSIRATIVTYTRTSSFSADRDSLTLYWGDGDSTFVKRSNGIGEELPNDIKRNEYTAEHQYPSRGTYKLSLSDPNRIAGILNVDFPNSVNIRFYIETTFTLLEPRFQGRNNSVILLQPPIDFACNEQVFTYNPNAYDADGDSLSYELVAPFSDEGVEVPNYVLPDQISSGSDNVVTLDSKTGDFRWDAPKSLGEYNITYKINEYRNGVLINSLIRDMQILVRACPDDNMAPTLETDSELCVVAGEIVEIDIIALDIDVDEILTITASGGPFELIDNPAVLSVENAQANSTLGASIRWQTTCDHVSEQSYQIVVRVTDEITRPMTSLATLKTITIKVVAPAPQSLDAINENGVVTLTWDNPYQCDQGENFRGFSIWRKINSSDVGIDSCQGGLQGQGYERIIFLTNEISLGRFIARDVEIDPGKIYCYRILAEFGLETTAGNPYNITQSITSDEVCIRSSGEEPLITNVSIDRTDIGNGALTLAWINPDSNAIDTTELTGPYLLEVQGANNLSGSNLSVIETYTYDSREFGSIKDTALAIGNLNTESSSHSYVVSFESGIRPDNFRATSDVASSVFLSVIPSDSQVTLVWEENVPWNNYLYRVYENTNGSEILVDSSTSSGVRIENLENGTEYCFRIESFGSYRITGVPEPLINFSNLSCAVPEDDVAPCPPSISVSSICDSEQPISSGDYENIVRWSYNDASCSQPSDLDYLNIYFSEDESGPLVLIDQLDVDEGLFIHQLQENIAGCYAISAVDVIGNESEQSEKICIDNCPTFDLPNTFTPNNDNSNDIYRPRQNRFIDRIEFEVYNRWGEKVYETMDPNINWDGTNLNNKDLAEGTYFYSCMVFEKRVSGVVEGELLKGTIQIVR